MRLEAATMALEQRSVGATIDLAILFYRQHAPQMLALTVIFGAIPTTIGAYRAAAHGDGWLWSGLAFFFVSPFLGAALVAGAGHHVFGEEFTVGNALRYFWSRIGALLVLLPFGRAILGLLTLMCWGVFTVPLASRYGYLSEALILERLRVWRVGKRLEEILRNRFFESCGRYLAIVSFASVVAVTLFSFIDVSSWLLLGIPIFFGKVSWAVAFDDMANLFSYDPVLVATWTATCWLVYPLARLAWFFCYLDARIRKEGWDVEIDFRVEARRLAPVS